MKNGRSTGKPTKAQAARFDAIKENGCVIANELGLGFIGCEIHHTTSGNKHGQKRRGHDFVVGLNQWSHRGVPFGGWDAARCRIRLGPSYALEPRLFREEWPDERLLRLQADQLGKAAP